MAAAPPLVTGKTRVKSKILVCTSKDIDSDYLSLLLAKLMDMEIGKDFNVVFYGCRNCLILLERKLPKEELKLMIETIEANPLDIQLKATTFEYCKLLLSDVPSLTMSHLELWIERLIGREKKFILKELGNNRALLEFRDSMSDEELDSIVAVITSTEVRGANTKVQILELPYMEIPSSASSPCTLHLSGIPLIDLNCLGALIQRNSQLKYNLDFFLEQNDDHSSLMTCTKQLSKKELERLLKNLKTVEVKGACLKVEVQKNDVSSENELIISNMPPNCELGFLGYLLEQTLPLKMEEQFVLTARDDLSASVTFKQQLSSQDLVNIIEKINKTMLNGNCLRATVCNIKKESASSEDASSLLLRNMPDNISEQYLAVILSKEMGIKESEFLVKYIGSGAVMITFKKCLSESALQDRINKIGRIKLKEKFIEAISWKTTPCICISQITQHYDEEYLERYFESRGGKVVSVELFGNGEAKVVFKDLKVMRNVIQMQHQECLGQYVTVIQDNPMEKPKPGITLQNVQIEVSSDIVVELQRKQCNWSTLLSNLHVTTIVDVYQAVITIVPSKHTPAGWNRCETIVRKYIDDNFQTKDLTVSKEAVPDIMRLMKSRYTDVVYSVSEDDNIIHLVGHPDLFPEIEKEVCDIVASVEIIEKQLKFDPEDYEFILQTKQKEIHKTAQNVMITFTAPNSICLNGAARDVKKLEESIIKFSVHSSITMVMDPLFMEFVCTRDGWKQLQTYLCSSRDISVAIYMKASGCSYTVVVLCDPEVVGNVTKAVNNTEKELHIEKLTLSSKCIAKLSETTISRDYNELYEILPQRYGVIVKRYSCSICIAGFKYYVNQTLSVLNDFIQAKCKVTRQVTIENGMWQLFQTHMKSEWDALVSGFKGIENVTKSVKNNTTIRLSGQIDMVDEMYEALLSLKRKVSKTDISPARYITSFNEYEKSNEWEIFYSGLQNVHKVSIVILNSEIITETDCIVAEEAHQEEIVSSLPWSTVWTSSNLKCVKIHKGNLLDVKADVYVNSSNANLDLDLGTGVISKILSLAAGPTLQEECIRKSPISPGQLAVTGSGNIKCKYIFHIVLKEYDGPGGNAEKILRESMDHCLDECRRQKVASIVFPALGTGVLHFPPQIAARIMMESVAALKDITGIKVHFVIFMDAVHKAFEEMKTSLEGRASYLFDTDINESQQPSEPLHQRHMSSHVIEMMSSEDESSHEYNESTGVAIESTGVGIDSESFERTGVAIESTGVAIVSNQQDEGTSPGNNITSFWFRIFGRDEKCVKIAAGALEQHLIKTFVCESIENAIVKPLADVLQLCTDNYITLSHDASAKTITLSGRKCGVDVVRRRIESDNIKHEKMTGLKREAELLHKQIQWQHQTSDLSYVSYPAEVNFLIEKAFEEKKQTYNHDDPTDPFCIDYTTFTETKSNPNSPSVVVKREDLLARYREDTPKTWEKIPIDPQTKQEFMYHLFDVKNTSQEFIDVHRLFALTAKVQRIITIQRVQNTMLHGQYIARKRSMEKLNPPNTKNESLLFHGTDANTCHKINSQGFNRSFAGKNATAFGKGVYFAVNASYSSSPAYSPPDANGYKYIYLARVLTGEFTIGNSSMIVPPAKNPSVNPNVLFDSLVDSSLNPTMYIIFQDAQAYPEYLITFVV